MKRQEICQRTATNTANKHAAIPHKDILCFPWYLSPAKPAHQISATISPPFKKALSLSRIHESVEGPERCAETVEKRNDKESK